MKNLIFLLFVLLVAWSCSPSKKTAATGMQLTIQSDSTIKSDSTEYEIIIIDPEFDHWYLLQFSPAKDHSNEYYRNKNQAAVVTWNGYFNRNRYHRIIEDYIYFDNSVDYGLEVNRKLYWYFSFVEEKYRIRLLL